MSISNLLGPSSAGYQKFVSTTKTYIPNGVILKSPIFLPADGIVNAGAPGRRVQIVYTKVNNVVSINLQLFGVTTDLPAVEFTGIAGNDINITNVQLGATLQAQITNDLQVLDATGAVVNGELNASIGVGANGNSLSLRLLTAGGIQVVSDVAGGLVAQLYRVTPGTVICSNNTIL